MTESDVDQLVSHLAAMLSFASRTGGQAASQHSGPVARRGCRPSPGTRIGSATRNVASSTRVMPRAWSAGSRPRSSSCWARSCEFEVQRDERTKLLSLPLWQVDSLAGGVEGERSGDGLFADFLPHIIKLCRARGQLERQIALLRHVEALRLYAAGHDGKLPARLSDIPVPLPVRPVHRQALRLHGRGDHRPPPRRVRLRARMSRCARRRPLRGDDVEVIVPDLRATEVSAWP